MLMMFVVILAWVGLIGGGVVTGLRIWCALSYTKVDEVLDGIRGVRRTHPIAVSGTIFLISFAFLLARQLS